ncbi:hypothetical protein K2173_015070 [Erythroxylum novogranatense]|uniref:Peptidase A1 domain-containing protein n=1 Tax=Erythroxylum novogranatense TaxID=1862640 RepID=A0AAV8T2G8_9ROSI|nr:hypothetical protein K2173_015070 [Erythroxylum novogranatense]
MPFSLLLILLSLTFTDICNSTQDSLKLPLLHRTPIPTPFQVLSSDHYRLHHHHRHYRASVKSPIISGASSGSGQYFVSLRLGSPPQPLLLVADTGSDLIWVKCSACKNCSEHPPSSSFLTRHSSSFSPTHCFNNICRLVPHPDPNPCNKTRLHSPCRYEHSYSDGSVTSGFFSRETTTLNTSSGKETKLKNLAFGCGFHESGPSVTGPSFNGAQGVMGLGRGPISISSQLSRRFGNKFSYCLMDYTLSPPPTSFLIIGGSQNDLVPQAKEMSFTPILANPLLPTFYYIGITSVFVNGVKLRIDPSVWTIDEMGNGGTVIDSGTTLTFIKEPAYGEILTAFKRRLKLPSPVEPTPGFDLCVNVSGIPNPSLPRMRLELVGGAVLSPPQRNLFIQTSERVKCLAVQPVEPGTGFSVIGNVMQQGYLLEFDRDRSRLGFSRRGCALPAH